ncbi:MAG: GreA/GreB family elongation factor [Chitinophagaceae bacterium]|nr:GreA/GreB family elongation factor [Chitinophagaceae bacterium]
MLTLKQKIFKHFQQLIDGKAAVLQKVLDDLKESGANETKSTAGDKHETALAMIQIEQANTRAQLQELLLQKEVLEKIDPAISASVVLRGSLVKSGTHYFFISTALGKAVINKQTVFALSPESPLGQKLMGLKTGDRVSVNNLDYLIESIH